MFDIGIPELLIILVIILLLFGSKRLPKLSKSLGQSLWELRKNINGDIPDSKKSVSKKV
jgi:sec-independent protein translocase protein TatA